MHFCVLKPFYERQNHFLCSDGFTVYFQASALFCGIDRPGYAYIIGSQTGTDSQLRERAKKENCGFTSLDGVQNDGKKRGKITGIKKRRPENRPPNHLLFRLNMKLCSHAQRSYRQRH